MKRIIPLLIVSIFCMPVLLFAQDASPSATLAYYEDDTQIEILDSARVPVDVYFGMELQPGDTVRTNATIAELQLEPNGSIIKLSRNTVFTVDELQKDENTSNKFSMAAGKMRAVAARAGIGNRYQVSTPSAVCGVRGTDFGILAIPGQEESAFVNQGEVEFIQKASQSVVTLTRGMTANALADTFEAVRLSQERIQELLQDMQFERLDPSEVPGHEPVVEQEAEEEPEEESEEPEAEDTEEPTEEEEPEVTEDATIPGAAVTAAGSEDAAAAGGRNDGKQSALARAIGDIFGFEIGTVTMHGRTYSKAVVKPHVEIGKLKLGLYLPIVYNDDLFDYGQWYRPGGNNEWSFGSEYDWSSEPGKAAQDALIDLALKIHYLEWGEQRDPFFLKLGNLHNMTIGHGTIMKNFANDLEFPSVRRVGLNMGIDRKKSGFELVVNDIAEPEIFGGRVYVRPIGRFAMGVSSIVDIDPLSTLEGSDYEITAVDSMRFVGLGADVELPVFENEVLSIIPFADVAAMVPQKNGEMQWDMVYNSDGGSFADSVRNYGLTSGIFGNLLSVDYNLEWRYYHGVFRPTFFNSTYERNRGSLAVETNEYLDYLDAGSGSSDYEESVMGIYGSAHTVLLNLVDVKSGYMWPLRSIDELEDPSNYNDEFSLSVYLLPEAARFTKVYGGFEYSRTNFIPAFTEDELSLFDAYTSVKGEIVYPLAPSLDIAAIVSTSIHRDDEGNIVYDTDGDPEIVPNVTIETRVHF
ncbi:MAG: FecR family protein [Spirochaetia bacterium]